MDKLNPYDAKKPGFASRPGLLICRKFKNSKNLQVDG